MEWIKVKDQLPDVETEVMVSDGENVQQGYFAGKWTKEGELIGSEFYDEEGLDGEITHWMPIPHPPRA